MLSEIAQASLGRTAAISTILGLGFHAAIQSVEFEVYMFYFLGLTTASWPLLAAFYLQLGHCSILQALARTALVQVAFHGALLLSIVTYRVAFHRLRRFPGPFGAAVSRWYTLYLASKNVQYHLEVQDMHSKYGDFVRTGPREITILRKSAVDIIYGPKSECRKSSWYGQTGNDPEKMSIHMTRDFGAHRTRRKAWDKALSVKALDSYQPRITASVQAYIKQLRLRGHQGVNVTEWSIFLAFDLIGQVGMGKDFGQLSTGKEHSAIRPIHAHIKLLGMFQNLPWFLYLLGTIPGAASTYSEIFGFCANEIRGKSEIREKELQPTDIASWLLKAFEDKEVGAAPSKEALDDDSRVLLLAGSDTIASTLSQCLYHLVKYPAEQKRIQGLLDADVPGGVQDWSLEKARSFAYVDYFISETLRVKPALMLAGPRETPAGGLQIDEVFIPAGVNVLVPTNQIHQDPRYWKAANEFMPERWGSRREEMGTDSSPYLPFILGAYICPGRHLARIVVRAALSAILLNFDVSFAPGETGESFDKDVLDTFVVTLSSLNMCFKPRIR